MAAANANRFSTYTSASGGSEGKNGEKKDMWSSMLDSVASGKRLPEKNLLVMGTPTTVSWFGIYKSRNADAVVVRWQVALSSRSANSSSRSLTTSNGEIMIVETRSHQSPISLRSGTPTTTSLMQTTKVCWLATSCFPEAGRL